MPKSRRSSTTKGRKIQENLIEKARKAAREGHDIRPGTEAFWSLMNPYFVEVSQLLNIIQDEVTEELKAANFSGGEVRNCVICGGPIIKKHVRGRWPIYCDDPDCQSERL